MMDAIVQLLRNGLCCVKNLRLFEKSFLWDSSIPTQFYDFPEPLNQTTPLEVLISIFQLYALISCTRGGFAMMIEAFGKLHRLTRVMDLQTKVSGNKKETDDPATKIIQQSIVQEAEKAIRSVITGFLVCGIGCGFAWLAANSWHITSTNWIGGARGLIRALSVQEACLLPCLYFMLTTGLNLMEKSKRIRDLVKQMRGQKQLTPAQIELEQLELLTQWKPFWEAGGGLFEFPNNKAEEKLLVSENVAIIKHLEALEQKTADQVLDMADDLVATAHMTKMEAYREFVYFGLNLAAFYGYMMGIVCFYWQEEAAHPTWVRRFLMNMTVADADWRGNMAGDSAWTVEPIVILTSPFLLELAKPKRQARKVKAD